MKTSTQYDILIIGSGLGGLLCGTILSKKGFRICVLEKQSKIGGNLQIFQRDGCTFDTGLHYMGCLEEGQILHQVYKYLNLLDKLGKTRLDPNGFDIICIGNREFRFKNGFNSFSEALKEYFPGETRAIDTYVAKLREIWASTKLLNFNGELNKDGPGIWEFGQNAHDYIQSITSDKLLQAVLAGNNGLYTGNSKKTPLYVMANINSFFIQSAWRLENGGISLINAMKDAIEAAGGVLFVDKEVIGIQTENKEILSVECADSSRFSAKWYISNIHPSLTLDLFETGVFRKVYVNRIKELENSISAFTIYIVLKKMSFPHLNANVYFSKDENVWDLNADPNQKWPHGYMLYTAKDGETGYAETLTIMTMMRFDEVKQWENSAVNQRGESYIQFKKQKENELLDLVEIKYPGLRNHIESLSSSTPLTYRDYTGSVKGSIYGIEKDSTDLLKTTIFPKTSISNLLLTGQNINIHGSLGVTMGSLLTCANIIDIKELMKEIKEC